MGNTEQFVAILPYCMIIVLSALIALHLESKMQRSIKEKIPHWSMLFIISSFILSGLFTAILPCNIEDIQCLQSTRLTATYKNIFYFFWLQVFFGLPIIIYIYYIIKTLYVSLAKKTKISLIVAAAENNCIGVNNTMPWHIPEDFKHFKEITLGKPCIMGRKTYESILDQLGKPLPGRTSIVVSRSGYEHNGATSAASLEEAINIAESENTDEIMIIGGAQIYTQAIENNLANKIYLTRVHQSPNGDAFFPKLNDSWIEISKTTHDGFDFIDLQRS